MYHILIVLIAALQLWFAYEFIKFTVKPALKEYFKENYTHEEDLPTM
jgi:hypothetical protein